MVGLIDLLIISYLRFFVAGNDPAQSTTAWLDRYFGMVTNVRIP